MTLSERNAKTEAHNKKVLEKIVKTEKPNDPRFTDLTGSVFSKLVVTRYAGKDKKRRAYYFTKCECGSIPKLASSRHLTRGKIPSCGCLKTDSTKKRMTTHGLSKDPWYSRAYNQQQRMKNPKDGSYHNYGGRGLTFGEGMETIEDRVLFYHENFGEEPPKGMQIDRPENDLGYAKDNVALVSRRDNIMNRRNSHGHCVDDLQSRAYNAWRGNKGRGNLCEEWAADFKVFFADIGGEDLPKGKYLARFDVEKPFGPDNYYFSDTKQVRPSYLMPK